MGNDDTRQPDLQVGEMTTDADSKVPWTSPDPEDHDEDDEDLEESVEDALPYKSDKVDAADYVVSGDDVGIRLDIFATSRVSHISRSEAQRLISLTESDPHGVRVSGRRQRPGYRLREGDIVEVRQTVPKGINIAAEDLPLNVVYEDSDLIVVDKARGMVVHPAPGAPNGTLVNAILGHHRNLSGIGGELRPGIVHRLDKDTGGLLVVAKTDLAHRNLQGQIQSRNAVRRYEAIVWGVPKFETATVDAPIGRHPTDRKRMAVVTDPRRTARTAYTELTRSETFGASFALIKAKLQTGRTHQIRVHCAFINHPIVGDPAYGGVRQMAAAAFDRHERQALEEAIKGLKGQALHAVSLSFNHPTTGERLSFESPLPEALGHLLSLLRKTEIR